MILKDIDMRGYIFINRDFHFHKNLPDIKKMWYIHSMEHYSVIMNNDMWFEGKWV
jgi:hypothetical protein